MTLALVRQQSVEIKAGKTADKWKVFRDAAAAMAALGIQSNSLAVLDALLTFYPDNHLRQDAQMIVFPSNSQLALRAHGMSEATLRRHLAVLVSAGLIVRRDSANGKRFARKDRNGAVQSAFGFDLSPLLARSEELAALAQQVISDRARLRNAKESLTVCRRDVRKLISAAIEEGADGDWMAIEEMYVRLVGRIPRVPNLPDLSGALDEMLMLQEEIVTLLKGQEVSGLKSGNDDQIDRHIQNSKPESTIEFEPGFRNQPEERDRDIDRKQSVPIKTFPLGIVMKACPTILDYGAGGSIENWRGLMSAAVVVRSVLGVSPSAYQDACDAMGPENAAVAMACILERANFISSAGGYLRDLTRRAERGEFSLGPMIMALLKANRATVLFAG
jgi:replication initiation protein RepC